MLRPSVVAVLPGASFGPSAPQLFLPAFAAMRRGAELRPLEWAEPDRLSGLPRERWEAWVLERSAPLLRALPPDALVVAKSLGTLAVGLVADLGLAAVLVTPLLRDPAVVDALPRFAAPLLLAGGTADPTWDGALARATTPHVLELPGADHGLFVPGPLADSVANLAALAQATEDFLDGDA